MIRTFLVLWPHVAKDGSKRLRGEFTRHVIVRDDQGNEREYPVGAFAELRLNRNGSYSLLAAPDEGDDPQPEPARKSNHRQAIVNRQLRELEPEGMVPF